MATGVLEGAATARWLSGRKPDGKAPVRLFCFPYSGAGASAYRRWPGALAPAVDVCPVQLPGREGRISEPPFRRMSELVPAVARALLPHLERPFALFGHSLGALVAFELARHLRGTLGLEPVAIFASGHTAPHVAEGAPELHALPEPALVEELRKLGGTPEEVLRNEELRRLVFPTLRADFELCETYRYTDGRPLACRILAFGGLADDMVDREALEGWRHHTTAPFEARMFPGDHFFIHSCAPLVIDAVARVMIRFAEGSRVLT